jgi:hypothetical protein
MVGQVFDCLDHGLVGPLQLRDLLLVAAIACWGLSWQRQAVVGVGLHDRLILSPVVPLAEADGHDLRDQALSPKLEVVDAD